VLATLEVTNEGVHKGSQFEVRLPLIHVGRGSHNDISLPDDSVSDSHAKLQKRDDGWYVVDMGSTNGTYVAGRRIGTDSRLEHECDLRFGGIRMRFRAAGPMPDEARGTRAIAGVSVADARRAAAAAREPGPDLAPKKARGLPAYVWILAIVLLGLAVFFILQGQAQ
jgi:predicted component of type VI protein secretion system